MGGKEKIKLQKKIDMRLEKGQTKKMNMGWHMDKNDNPISAPSRWVCGKSFKRKIKKLGGGQRENKVPKRKFEIRGKKTRKRVGRK